VAIFSNNTATLVLDHEFGLLGTGEFAAPLDGVRLPVVQRVGSLRAVGLDRPSSMGTWLDCYLRFTCLAFAPPAIFDVSEGSTSTASSPCPLATEFPSDLHSNSVNTPSSR